ncbi:zinc-binding alcohol dehydrogenase family protein [Leuconostoc gasicomitatum]|uniref:zinc-binding alcohol dehydrogenase family protein n=1 Tax=Leuconostoc gasicomitatum TaxID=115778 RepID=UPI001CC7A010|nr:zinc-binding alcohol dehydrogenase family protein [Leuconostoc gasicomitatum]MBZ5969673.1 zinc-binding alcohol dehydrogenase family protein [Leuconostoc gasicomitatum]MBZ5997456.1 zinc-binding alcohol dehydrogenase family protein [Leuconostoc gasicomitatum]
MSLFDKIKKYWPFGGHKMRAIGFERALRIDQPNVFIEKNILQPKPSDHELLIKVAASAINPVDTKMRITYQEGGQFRILGFDATGEVIGLGKNVSKFEIGDLVYYAGVQINPGANAQYQVVNESLVGHAPVKISVAETAAMPLTAITAVEILQSFGFDVTENEGTGKSIFILNGAGGVGSTLIQLAKYLGLTVITTASRPESVTWVKSLGADYILDYHQDLHEQLIQIKHDKVDYIAILQDTNKYWPLVLESIKPFGRIASIVETSGPIDIGPLKNIGAQFNWVFMFAKGNYGVNMSIQGEALNKIADLLDNKVIKSTLTKTYKGLTVDNIKQATRDVESGHMIGKVVILHDEEPL